MSTSKLKKLLIVVLLLMTGCTNIRKEYTWPAKEKLENTLTEKIDKIEFSFETEGGRLTGETISLEEISKIRELLLQVSIKDETNMGYEDALMNIVIYTKDDILKFNFEMDVLVIGSNERYEVDNIQPLRGLLYNQVSE